MKLSDSKIKYFSDEIKKFSWAALTGLMVLGLAAIILFVPTTAALLQLAVIPGLIGTGILAYCITNIVKNAKNLNAYRKEHTQESNKSKVPTVEKNIIETQVIPSKSNNNQHEHLMGQ